MDRDQLKHLLHAKLQSKQNDRMNKYAQTVRQVKIDKKKEEESIKQAEIEEQERLKKERKKEKIRLKKKRQKDRKKNEKNNLISE